MNKRRPCSRKPKRPLKTAKCWRRSRLDYDSYLYLAKRGTIESQSLASEAASSRPADRESPITRPLKPRPRLRRRKIARLSGEGEGQERE